jgi:hypothetical protein
MMRYIAAFYRLNPICGRSPKPYFVAWVYDVELEDVVQGGSCDHNHKTARAAVECSKKVIERLETERR